MSRLHPRRVTALCVAALISIAVAGCGGSSASGGGKNVLSIAYGSTYVFATPAIGKTWMDGIASQFEKLHPGVTVNIVPIPGDFTDIVNKFALLYRSPSSAPTIGQLPTQNIGEFASSDYLLPLNNYLTNASWWNGYPADVKSEGTFAGTTYAVNEGENTQGLIYNRTIFKEAGIPMPWHPRTWQDVINAALKIKQSVPSVAPMWALGGTANGANGLLFGVSNFLAGSTTPTSFDTKTQKWVVDSAGLRETLGFYHTLAVDHLNAPLSDLFNTNAPAVLGTYMADGHLGIAEASNFIGSGWLKACAPCWKQAAAVVGNAPLPTVNGQGAGQATQIGGWDLGIYKNAPNPKLAVQLLDLMQSKLNLPTADNDGGWVPPVTGDASDPVYKSYGAPFQQAFASYEKYGQITPSSSDYSVWAQGLEQASGTMIQDPGATVAQAIQSMKAYDTQQLGSSKVETLP
jgi:multiple sugar transport system substrate-binding protein